MGTGLTFVGAGQEWEQQLRERDGSGKESRERARTGLKSNSRAKHYFTY